MKLLCYVPASQTFDSDGVAELLVTALSQPEIGLQRQRPEGGNWSQLLEGCCVVVAWVSPIGEGLPALQPPDGDVLSLLRCAQGCQIPTIVVGAVLDRPLKERLHELGVRAYVSAAQFGTFRASVQAAVDGALQCDRTSDQPEFHNMRQEIILDVGYAGAKWGTMGGYEDGILRPVTMAEWAPDILDLASPRPGIDVTSWNHELDRAGRMLGRLLVPDPDPEGSFRSFHRATCDVAPQRRACETPLLIRTPDEWIGLPFEAAVLPEVSGGGRLSHLHPVLRVTAGPCRAPWRPPLNRGLRVLLLASHASGSFDCPHGPRNCGGPLEGLDVDGEIREVAELFRDYRHRYPASVESISVPSRVRVEDIHALLTGEEWDIVHYAGHGRSCRRSGRREGCLLLPDARIPLPLIGGPAAVPVDRQYWSSAIMHSSPRALVYLSCCRSGDSGLLYAVAAHKEHEVIGFQSAVGDHAARGMARAFYAHLLDQWAEAKACDVGGALLAARLRMEMGTASERLAGKLCTVCVGDAAVPGVGA